MASRKNKNNENTDYNDRYIYSNSNKHVSQKSVKSKKIRNRKIIYSFAIIFSIIVGLLGGTFIYAYTTLDKLNYQPVQDSSETAEYVSGANQDPMVLNIALFGVDRHAQADVKSRSDSIMILSLDSRRKKIKLTSLMRDMWVPIPGYKDNRINTAIALGGEQLAIKTIEQNFGVKIDRFCTLDFEGFKDAIDIIDGLDISITKQEAHHINNLLRELDAALVEGGLKPFNSPLLEEVDGVHHMNGAQALQYARSRKVPTAEGISDDYARTFRQRRVISLVVEKLKTSSLPQLLSVIEKVGPYVNTNLKKNEIMTLGKNSLKYLQYEMSEFRLPENDNLEGKNINGASVLAIKDINKARLDLAKFIYEDSIKEGTTSTSAKSQKKNKSNNVNSSTNTSTKNTDSSGAQSSTADIKNTNSSNSQNSSKAEKTSSKQTQKSNSTTNTTKNSTDKNSSKNNSNKSNDNAKSNSKSTSKTTSTNTTNKSKR